MIQLTKEDTNDWLESSFSSYTRSNIAFAVSTVSQYMHSPYEAHMNVVYKILQYLKGTPGKGLHFGKHGQFKIEAFTNAN